MSGRWVWGGATITVAAVAGLAVYYAVVGLEEADKLGSVVGSLVAVVGVAVAAYGLAGAPAPGRRVSQRARATGRGQVTQVGGDQVPRGAAAAGGAGRPAAEGGEQVRQNARADEDGAIRQIGGDQGRRSPS
ncbi:hypothetical protein [Actinomadura sp. WMMB 499]|uniref:hypothetical protein n=1 Tax=Actinomadura sp. WMMB 499 TaxID=1219491 RepID=UPI001248E75E|nr:hypothetical protein [Actinomadura sp. WMMB 499]QFG24169.1 hypothetical protein F7P10_26640 [Actinomadura sp. WMMB 499]